MPSIPYKHLLLHSLHSQICLKTIFWTLILLSQCDIYTQYTKQADYKCIQCFHEEIYISFIVFIFSPLPVIWGFQAYLPAKHYLRYFLPCRCVHVWKYVLKLNIFDWQYKIAFQALYLDTINNSLAQLYIYYLHYWHL